MYVIGNKVSDSVHVLCTPNSFTSVPSKSHLVDMLFTPDTMVDREAYPASIVNALRRPVVVDSNGGQAPSSCQWRPSLQVVRLH